MLGRIHSHPGRLFGHPRFCVSGGNISSEAPTDVEEGKGRRLRSVRQNSGGGRTQAPLGGVHPERGNSQTTCEARWVRTLATWEVNGRVLRGAGGGAQDKGKVPFGDVVMK